MDSIMDTITLSFNREFAKQYGVNAALVYQEVYRKYFYWKSQGKLQDGYFWCDQTTMAEWLLISDSTLARCIKVLKDAGLIDTATHYKPGESSTTTWWKILNWESSSCQRDGSCGTSQVDGSYIKADTKADSEEDHQTQDMKPEVLYSRVHSLFKGPNEMRKQKIAALKRLREEFGLSDDTIINGMKAISENKTIKFKDGNEFTFTLTYLLLREDLERTAALLVQKAEQAQNTPAKIKGMEHHMKFGDM